MEEKVETQDCGIGAISFDKMLSISNLFGKVIRYGKHCCLLNINSDTDKELFKYPVRIYAFIFVVCSNGLIELTYNLFRITLSSNNLSINQVQFSEYSSISIQEIAYALNFPNQSFFGKYFKRHTGLSPKAYRLQQ